MTLDAFAVFGLERGPGLNRSALQARYDELCRGEKSEELHRARAELLSPSRRLKGLLGEEKVETQGFPSDLMEEFAQISTILRAADVEVLAQRGESSELARALRFPAARKLQRELEVWRERLERGMETAEDELSQLAAAGDWRDRRERLGEIRAACGFRERWIEQLRQAWVSLVY